MSEERFTVTPEILEQKFAGVYGDSENPVRIFASPARINIIGEHIDYNGGKVFPAAIDRYLYVAARIRGDRKIVYNDLFFPGKFEFTVDDEFAYSEKNDYANFLNGILSIMKRRGYSFSNGFDVLIASNVPAAGGISSSSALECGFAWAVSELFGFGISRKDIALMGQQSEHEFMNVNCGIMDQYIIATGKKGTAELLDCASVESEYVPLNLGGYSFVVMNTKKQRRLADSKYNERRSECERALGILKAAAVGLPESAGSTVKNTSELENLCEMTPEQFEACADVLNSDTLFRRVRHCVTENARVLRAVRALREDNLEELGRLLCESHESLKNDYEVTGTELDTLKNSAMAQKGCIGARMTGAGFGGCAIALVRTELTDEFIRNVQAEYTAAIGHEGSFFSCSSGDGVRTLR